MTDAAATHQVEVEPSFSEDVWQALCSCGWQSLNYGDRRLAEEEGRQHLHATRREPSDG